MSENSLETKLATQTNGEKKNLSQQLMDKIMPHKLAFEQVIPKTMDIARFIRLVNRAVMANPDLQQASIASILGCAMNAAQLGLEPNTPMGTAYILPFKSKNGMQAQFVLGYRGMLELAYRNSRIESIGADVVKANDVFEWEQGTNAHIKHSFNLSESRGETVGAFATCKMSNGGTAFVVVSKPEIDAIKRSSKSAKSEYSPWQTHYDEMAKKTAIRRLFKLIPSAIEIAEAIERDNTMITMPDVEFPQTMQVDIVDAEIEDLYNQEPQNLI